MKAQLIKFFLIITLFAVNKSFGQVGIDKLAQSTMNFQLVSVSPKASAMGDAFFAAGGGSESVFYNPAGIVDMNRTFEVSFNYTQWIADINYLAGSIAYNMGNYGTVGLSMLTVDYGDIIGTKLIDPAEIALHPEGYIDTGTLSNVGAYSFGLTYAKAISTLFAIGGNIRMAGQNLGNNNFVDGTAKENNAAKLVFDAGVKYNTGYKNFKFGMAIRNFAANIKREEIEEQLPLTFTIGTSVDLWDIVFPDQSEDESLTLAVDFLHSNSYSERVNMGLEYNLLKMISLRAGYQTNRDIAAWSGGFGVHTIIGEHYLEFNYSYSQIQVFDNVNRLSLKYAF